MARQSPTRRRSRHPSAADGRGDGHGAASARKGPPLSNYGEQTTSSMTTAGAADQRRKGTDGRVSETGGAASGMAPVVRGGVMSNSPPDRVLRGVVMRNSLQRCSTTIGREFAITTAQTTAIVSDSGATRFGSRPSCLSSAGPYSKSGTIFSLREKEGFECTSKRCTPQVRAFHRSIHLLEDLCERASRGYE